MEIGLRKIGEICIVDLPQDIFINGNEGKLKNTINELIDQGSLNILLNMANVIRIDGTGLGALLNLQKVALYYEIKIRLYGLQPYVSQMLYQTRLNKVFDICQAEEEYLSDDMLSDSFMIA